MQQHDNNTFLWWPSCLKLTFATEQQHRN